MKHNMKKRRNSAPAVSPPRGSQSGSEAGDHHDSRSTILRDEFGKSYSSVLKKVLCLSLVLLVIATAGYGGDSPFDYEVIVMLKSGIITMPSQQDTADIDDVTFSTSSSIEDTLIKFDADTIIVAFPDWDPADSVLTSSWNTAWKAKQLPLDQIFRIRVDDPEDRDDLNVALEGLDEVWFSFSNGGEIEYCRFEPNDPYFKYIAEIDTLNEIHEFQWWLDCNEYVEDTQGLTLDTDIDAPEAWAVARGVMGDHLTTSDAKIGVFDSAYGIPYSWDPHPDHGGRVEVGENFPEIGESEHGNHVIGIIGAETNNDTGVAGIHGGAEIYFRTYYHNDGCYDMIYHYESMIDFFAEGCIVTNHSWRMPADTPPDPLQMYSFMLLYELGVLNVAGRGNIQGDYGPTEPGYPACLGSFMMNVGSHDIDGELSDFSQYACGIDLVAPGNTILSTGDGWAYPNQGSLYEVLSGTSMSSPVVAGIAALVWDYYYQREAEAMRSDDLHEILKRSATWEQDYNETHYGAGRVNANDALNFIRPTTGVYLHNTVVGGTAGNGTNITPDKRFRIDGPWVVEDDQITRYQVTTTVQFSTYISDSFLEAPEVWGVGIYGCGYPSVNTGDDLFPIFTTNVDGNPTTTSVTLKTYIYQIDGEYYPCPANEVLFCFTVVGDNIAPSAPSGLEISRHDGDDFIFLEWTANSEDDLDGYKIYRNVDNAGFTYIDTVAAGTEEYVDEDYYWAPWQDFDHIIYYEITAYDETGNESDPCTPELIAGGDNPPAKRVPLAGIELPTYTALLPNYPNPFNPVTTLRYALHRDMQVRIQIFDVTGRLVMDRDAGYQQAGWYNQQINLADKSSGLFFVRAVIGNQQFNQKILLIK